MKIPCGHETDHSSGDCQSGGPCFICNLARNQPAFSLAFGMKPNYKASAEDDGMIVQGLPCKHKEKVEKCYFCNNWDANAGYTTSKQEAYNEPSPARSPKEEKVHSVAKNNCISLGKVISPSPNCGCGSLFECKLPQIKECRKLSPGPTGSATCLNCSFRVTRDQERPNPKAGVVIGTYGYPNLVALQVKLIRKHNPGIPIMLVDDCSDGTQMTPLWESNFGKLCRLQIENDNVEVWSNPVRMGHAGGDLTSFFCGLQWAKRMGLDALVKLSFRFILDIDNWVQVWLDDFWKSGWATSSQKCREVNTTFDIRSECVMMDVKRWADPEILNHIRPRPLSLVVGKFGVAAENVLWDDIRDRLDNGMHKCKFFTEDRMVKSKGILWHLSNGKEEYIALHKREGLEIDENYTNCGWMNQPGYEG